MISAIAWVPKGASKAVPITADPPPKEEIDEILKAGVLETHISREDSDKEDNDEDMDVTTSKPDDEVAQALAAADMLGKGSKNPISVTDNISDALKELNMDNYDEEDDGIELFGAGLSSLYYPSNEMDPYMKDKDDDDSEDLEDMTIKPDDIVIVCAQNKDDVSHLEVYVMEDLEGELSGYPHHEIYIPAFPLCLAWLDCPLKGGEKGNFVAVGSMEPSIEIWDLDMIDEVQPSAVLGGIVENKKKKKGGAKKSVKYKDGSHTDSVLGLAWNKEFRNVLASASADKTVKIWDVATEKCNITLEHHTDKVQAVAWNHFEPSVLLSGSFDRSIAMKDVRVPSHTGLKWSVSSDVESLAWDPHNNHNFVVSLENGMVTGFDIRVSSSSTPSELQPSFTLHAHDKAVSTISYNPLIPNLLATGSMDKTVKLWDLSNNQPSLLVSKTPKAGAVFSVSFSNDYPYLLVMGGSKGTLHLWDGRYDPATSSRFGKYSKQNGSAQS